MARRFKNGKKLEFVRATAMFKSDDKYVPKGAKLKYGGRATGEYLEAVADVVNKAVEKEYDLLFSFVKWKGEDHPVLSLAAAKPRERDADDDDEDDKKERKGKKGKKRDEDEDDDDDDKDDDDDTDLD
jgi:hypothetical protein